MRRNRLFNKIISLSLVIALYLSMSASAYAELETEVPAVESNAVVEEVNNAQDVPAEPVAEVEETTEPQPAEEPSDVTASTNIVEEIVETIKEAIGDVVAGDSEEAEETDDEEPADDAETEDPDAETEDPEEATEENIECEHELQYSSNNDGTHKVTCSKCEELEEYTESCEYDEAGVCIKCGYHRLPDPILTYEDDEVIVKVSGAVPEKADLKVTPLKADVEETKAAYEEVEKKLVEETDITKQGSYGFVAYDIKFVNIETKEEVEPSGDVTVNLEYKTAVCPITVDDKAQVDVSLIHINEQSNSVDVLTDTEKASLELNDSNGLTKAEFTSDSFSAYVVTWVKTSSAEVKLTFNNKDYKTNENLSEGAGTLDITDENPSVTEIEFATYLDGRIPGYSYKEAKWNNKVVTKAIVSSYKKKKVYYYEVELYENDTEITAFDSADSSNKLNIPIEAYYKEDSNLSVSKIATGAYRTNTTTTYNFVLLDSSNNPVAGEGYVIGNDSYTTDSSGAFTLKSGDKAEFEALEDGTYSIIEKDMKNPNDEKISLKDFITKVYVGDLQEENKKQEYEADFSGDRKLTVDVSAATKPQVIYKNLYRITSTETRQAELTKFIQYMGLDDNDVETYRLNAKFEGPEKTVSTTVFDEDVEEQIKDAKVNIIILFDKSMSMSSNNRLNKAISAVGQMVSCIKAKEHVDAKWAVVDFNSYATVVTQGSDNTGWVDTDKVMNYVTTKQSSGTNYDYAFYQAEQLIQSLPEDRKDGQTMVVFLTDGQPTTRGGYEGYPHVKKGYYTKEMLDAALDSVAKVKCDAFFAVGVGLGTYDIYNEATGRNTGNNITGKEILLSVVDKAKSANNLNEHSAKVNTVGADDLEELFIDIAAQIETLIHENDNTVTQTYYSTVTTMQDKLSDYVEVIPGSEFYISVQTVVEEGGDKVTKDLQSLGLGKWEGLSGYIGTKNTATYEIYDGDTTYVLEADYDPDTKTFNLIFPQGYELNKGYSYTVSFQVTPTELAYNEYLATGYPEGVVGDVDTDNKTLAAELRTSEGKPGFYSNDADDSYVKYVLAGTADTKYFAKPVVQVHFKNVWEIYKTDADGKAGKRLGGAQFLLKENVDDPDVAYLGTSSIDDGNEGKVIWDLKNDKAVPVNKTYIITEEAVPTGYAKCDDHWELTLDADNKPTVKAIAKQGVETACESEVVRNKNVITYKFYYKNIKQIANMPNTGGRGTTTSNVLGFTLIMFSAYICYRNRKSFRFNKKG